MNTKVEQIQLLKKKYSTLTDIGANLHPPISGERVRQILSPKKYTKCKKHKILFLKNTYCLYCLTEQEYPKFLDTILKKDLLLNSEIRRLSKEDRHKVTIIRRTLLIQALKDKKGWSLTDIAHQLHRDFTSVKHLYQKKI